MVGEEEDLGAGGQLREHLEGGARALVVEVHEDVVHDEGHGFGAREVLLEGGEAQGQEELVAGPRAHPLDTDAAAVGAQGHELGTVVFVVVGLQAAVLAEGERAK